MRYVILTPPATEPVSVAEAKAHLRIAHSDEDALVAQLTTAARLQVEQAAGLALVTQRVREILPWPSGEEGVGLSVAPVITLLDVRARRDGVDHSLSLDRVSLVRNGLRGAVRIAPAAAVAGEALMIEYDAGFGASAAHTPADLRQCILEVIARRYANREGGAPDENAWRRMLDAYLGRAL